MCDSGGAPTGEIGRTVRRHAQLMSAGNTMQFRTRKLALVVVAVVGATAFLVPGSHSIAQTTSDRDELDALVAVDTDAALLAKSMDISFEDAKAAIQDSEPLYDFTLRYTPDPRFGAVWATYEDGYEIHLRVTGKSAGSFEDAIDDLAGKVTRPIAIHTGGASAEQLWDVAMVASAKRLPVTFQLNQPEGTIELFANSDPSAVPADFPDEFITLLAEQPPVVPRQLAAGADVKWFNGSFWAPACTAGLQYGGFGATGFITAGHCPDATPAFPSSLDYPWDSTSTIYESCTGVGDLQVHQYIQPIDPNEKFMRKNPLSYSWVVGIAAGWYSGQPSVKIGLWGNATQTTVSVVFTAVANFNMPAGGDCGGGVIGYALLTYNGGMLGDSGGPILLEYNGKYLAATIHSAGSTNPNRSYGTWLANFNPGNWAPSGHWCTKVNPCGPLN